MMDKKRTHFSHIGFKYRWSNVIMSFEDKKHVNEIQPFYTRN